MDRRRLRTANDIERNGLMGVAAEATKFKVKKARIERITERGATAAPDP
jgi:hypothetical protein